MPMSSTGRINEARIGVGRRIKELRQRQGISQSTFADMVSISRTYLCQVEHGSRNVTISNLVKISDGLDVPLVGLFEEEEDATR